MVSTIIGAAGDGGLNPDEYDNTGPLTEDQLAAIDSAIGDAIDEARDEGVESVDITSDNDDVYNVGFSAGQLSVDITSDNDDLYNDGFQAGVQSFDLDLLGTVAAQQEDGGLVDLEGFTQDQIDAYNEISVASANDFQVIRSLFAQGSISNAEAETLFNTLYESQTTRRADFNQDGNVSTADLLDFLTYLGSSLEAFNVPTSIPEEFLITTPTGDGDGTIGGPGDGVAEN